MNLKKFLPKNKTNKELLVLLISIIVGCFVGISYPNFMTSISWIGKIFMNTLMSLVLPLIFFSLVSAITSSGDIKKVGKLGIFTLIIILVNVCLAAFVGLIFSIYFKPGHSIDATLLIHGQENLLLSNKDSMSFSDFIVSMFPPNLGEIAIKSQILPIVIFSVFFSIIAIKNINKN